ncbi:uncharacterized protein LOC114731948 isoform X2 [Neltuma alba]|uniref:uncharacterized protein LOC114731948 isoform X2 n=1 Tax=Neltuma alba TaxID=207710 RepID=UPI0010A584DE|nr:uncharacterized protein LOC114731948 isoform X2 [Prosopis alba]
MADYQHRRHDHYHKFHHHQTGRFMPMLCSRPSMLEDVTVPRWRNRTASLSDDPLSPRIGCMGQVKRNNKVVGLPTTSQSRGFISLNSKCNVSSSTPFSALVKYSKLGKIFYAKNLSTNTPDTAHTATSCGGKRRDLARNDRNRGESCVTVSIEEMDPPLPVVKRAQKSEAERGAESLWKRRSGGVALRTLQLQHIHHPRHLLQPTSV